MSVSLSGSVRLRPQTRAGFIDVGASASAPFTPSSISGLDAWFKADALVLNDGDAVGTWTDSSTNARNATQGTVSRKPIYKTNIQNGKPIVRFVAASNQWVETAAWTSASAQWSVFAVENVTAGAAQYLLSTDRCAFSYDGGAAISAGATGGSGSNAQGTAVPGTFQVVSAVLTASTIQAWVNGASTGSSAATPAAATSSTLRIGKPGAFAVFMNGDIGEALVYAGALSTSDRQAVEAYLKAKWGTA